MAILIKGISMPKEGKLIDLTIKSDGTVSETWDLRNKQIGQAVEASTSAERTGKWVKRRGVVNCSTCKNCSWSFCFEDIVRRFEYCPKCGAKMGVSR